MRSREAAAARACDGECMVPDEVSPQGFLGLSIRVFLSQC